MLPPNTFTTEQIHKFQNLLIHARRTRGMTQGDAAEAIGVSQTLISTLEKGPSWGMRTGDLFKVLIYYGIEPNAIAEALGFAVEHGLPRVNRENPRVAKLLTMFSELPDDTVQTILTNLEWTLQAAVQAERQKRSTR